MSPHPPQAGWWCSCSAQRPNVSLTWCPTRTRSCNGLNLGSRTATKGGTHDAVIMNLTPKCPCERADARQQRYLCKACGLNFTNTPTRGKPLALKAAAVLLYVSGLSMNRTAQLLGVSPPTIQAWLEQFAQAYAQRPKPEGRAVVIELDES